MNNLKLNSFIKIIAYLFILFFFISTCTDFSILGELVNTRLNIILKSTYETNDPLEYDTIYLNDYIISEPYREIINYEDLEVYLDLADIRLGRGTELPSLATAEEYWRPILRERIILCSNVDALFDRVLDTCQDKNGIERLNQFLDDGVLLPARDVEPGNYSHLAIYMRRLIINPARYYNASDDLISNIQADFDNGIINGQGFINSRILLYEPLDAADSIPDLFPLQRIDLDLEILERPEQAFVIEIRIFIKSILMLHLVEHESEFLIEEQNVSTSTFIAPSDWRYAHDYKNISSTNIAGNEVNELLGRQLLLSARVYYPDSVGTLTIQSDDSPNVVPNTYYVLVNAGSNWDPEYELPLIATNANLPSRLINIPLNQKFDLYKTCDLFSRARSSYDQDVLNHDVLIQASDGFPETKSLCQTDIELTENNRSQIVDLTAENNLGCPCEY